MSDYSAVAPPQNINHTAFAAALQRARQIAAKINPGAAAGDQNRQKRPLDDSGPEPEPKKLAGLDFPNNQSMSPAKSDASATSAGHIGLTGNSAPPPSQGPVVNEDIKVPDNMVGLIIGRGGEQITRLQAETGCKIQIGADGSGQPERVCSLSGPPVAIQRAKDMIYNIIQTHQRSNETLTNPNNFFNNSNPEFAGLGSQGGGGGGGGGVTQVEIMVPGPKVGLIIGKGGETIKQLQEKSGAKMVVIQEGPNPEQEKPLRITGDPQKVEYAKQLVYDLIAEKEMQAYRGGPRGGGGQGPPNQGNQMNRDNRGGGPGGYQGGNGDGDYGGNNGGNGNGDGIEVQVPRAAVGVVIGKGGDMIKKIQAETGAKVQFQQGRDDGPGDRRCFLTGKPQNVEAARQRIEELIDSVHRRDNEGGNNQGPNQGRNNGRPGGNNGGQGRNDFNNSNANQRNGGYGAPQWGGPGGNQSQIEVTFQVPTYKCGVIIGRGGETIKQINQQSGAHCELDRRAQSTNGQEKTFIIRGDPDCVENAKRIISEKIQMPLYFTPTSNSAGAQQGMAPGPMNPAAIPTAYPGMAPQQAYTPQQQWATPGAPGPDTTTAAYPQQWPQQNTAAAATQIQINPQTGQPDYSKQWAEYYRSLGMHREADMIEQQAKGGAVSVQAQPAAATVTPVAGQQPAATQVTSANGTVATAAGAVAGAAQPDYSAQWAEYYRSIGKIKEAEAIEAQMKSKAAAAGVATSAAGAAVSVAGAAAVTSTPSAPVQAAGAVVTATPAQPFAGYANYGGYYAQAQQQPLATAAGAPAGGAAPQAQYGFPGYGQAYGQPQPQAENANN